MSWGLWGIGVPGPGERTAGANGDLPEGMVITHRNYPRSGESSWHAHHNGEEIGSLYVMPSDYSDRGAVGDISVHDDYLRRGVATALWEAAGRPLHTPGQQTGKGQAWAQAVGGDNDPDPAWNPDDDAYDFSDHDEDEDYDDGDSPFYTSAARTAAHPSTYEADHPLGQIAANHPNVDLNAWESPQGIKVNMIQVAPEHQGKGYAGAALRDLISYADAQGLPIALTPGIPEGRRGMSQAALKRWYSSHGFVPNKGRNKDWNWAESMIRPARAHRTAMPGEQIHKDCWNPGDIAHFEYHCSRTPESGDFYLWKRTQRPVTVEGIADGSEDFTAELPTANERIDEGVPLVYKIKFEDGTHGTAFEDELLNHPKFFSSEFSFKPENAEPWSEIFGDSPRYIHPEYVPEELGSQWVEHYQKLHANNSRTVASRTAMPVLYRGLQREFDPDRPATPIGAPNGYSHWTDSPDIARQWAGPEGHVYSYDLPDEAMGSKWINENADGKTPLYFDNGPLIGRSGAPKLKGREYLVYNDHDDYDPTQIKPYKKARTMTAAVTVPVGSQHGLHTTPSMLISNAVKRTGWPVWFSDETGTRIDARDPLAVMSLGARHGAPITVHCDHPEIAAHIADYVAQDHD